MRNKSIYRNRQLIFLGVVMAVNSIAHADTIFTVNTVEDRIDDDTSDGVCHTSVNTCSLRAAFMQANTLTVPITRISIPAGTFVLTRPPSGALGDSNGDLDLNTPMVGNQRVIVTGAGAGLSVIDGNQGDRVFYVAEDRHVEIAGVTFRNGRRVDSAGAFGGAIANFGTLLLEDSVIEGNRATTGGGIYTLGTLHIRRSTIRSNIGSFGGGLFIVGPTTIEQSSLHGNSAINFNGSRGNGGAVDVEFVVGGSGSLRAVNTTFSQNTSDGDGGAISTSGGTFLYNSTVFGNDADHDRDELGGIGGGVSVSGGLAVVVNTLIADNTILDAPIPDNCNGTLEAYGWNLLDDVSGCTFTGNGAQAHGFISPATIGPLQNNGGPTLTHALLPGSQAIDTTFPQGCISDTGALLTTDQRGATRVSGARCDVGAFEYGAALDVIFSSGFE